MLVFLSQVAPCSVVAFWGWGRGGCLGLVKGCRGGGGSIGFVRGCNCGGDSLGGVSGVGMVLRV